MDDLVNLDPDRPLSIFSGNMKIRRLIKSYILYFRFIGVKVYDICVKTDDGLWVVNAEMFQAKVDMNKDKKDNVKIRTRVVQLCLHTLEVLDSCVLEVVGSLNTDTGQLGALKLNFDARMVSVRVLSLIKRFKKTEQSCRAKQPVQTEELDEESRLLAAIYNRLLGICYLVKLVESLDVSFQGINVHDLPLASNKVMGCPKYDPMVLLHVNVKSVVFSIKRMFTESPGYGLLFSHDDKPYRFVYNWAGVSVCMVHVGAGPPKEIISVPSMNVTGTSNVAFRTLEATITKEVSFAKAIISGHLSEPVIDMSTKEISIAVQSVIDFLKYWNIDGAESNGEYPPNDTSSSRRKIWIIQKKISRIWPLIDFKFGIENPVMMTKSPYDEDYLKILMLKLSLLSLEFKTSRDNPEDPTLYSARQKLEFHNISVAYRDTKTCLEERILRVGEMSLKQLFTIIPNNRVSTALYTEGTKLDLSNILVLNGVNHITTELDSLIVPQVRRYRRSLNLISTAESPSSASPTPTPELCDERTAIEIVHDMIPIWLQCVEYSSVDTTILVGSRSLLLNKELVKLIDPQATNDLVNGELRKVKLSIENWDMKFSAGIECLENIEASNSPTLEDDDMGLMDTSSESSANSDKWSLKIRSSRLIGKIISERSHKKHELAEKIFLKVPESNLSLKPCLQGGNTLFVSWNIERIEAFYSVMTHFIIFSAFHLVRNTVLEFLHKNPVGEVATVKPKSDTGKKIADAVHAHLNINFFDMIMVMPDKMKMRLELTDFQSSGKMHEPALIGSSYALLCTESPTSPGFWSRIIVAVNGSTKVNLETILTNGKGPWIETMNDTCHITCPHQLIIYKIFDNISVLVKTLKQLRFSLKNNSDEFIIHPKAKHPSKIPKVRLKSQRVFFSMDDDPFEAELNMIFQIGLLEQKMRVEKLRAFDRRIAEELQVHKKPSPSSNKASGSQTGNSTTGDKINSLRSFPKRAANIVGHGHSNSISTYPETVSRKPILPDPTDLNRVREITQEKLHKIYEGFSKSWIARVKAYRSKIDENFKDSFKYIWGNLGGKTFPPGFDNKVLDFVRDPPLFNLILEGFDLDICEPRCGLEHLPEFLHDVGKGVPIDSEYSTLIPLHVDLKLTELKCHLRDYPLPMIHMPKITKKQDPNISAVRLHGDLVISEFMIKSQEEVREVFVPLVPGCGEFDEDNCYSIEVPKTLTSIKFYTDLDWELNSERDTRVSWSSSYQPCIQQIMLNLDNFTKPPIDPSDKVGFWDKIRANLHARVHFKFAEKGQLNVFFKGSKDPYSIGGESAGFVLGFKDNVTLTVNENDDPKEFICAKANEIMFASPNHFARPLTVWSKPTDRAVLLSDTSTNYQKSSFGYYLHGEEPIDPEHLNAMGDDSIEKSVIKLSGDVSFKLGFSFERKIEGSLTRTSEFIPHYDVILRNPKYVRDRNSYDAYRGFRSQFIHMAFTLVSLKEDAYNTIQLSPKGFQYFFAWWKMFSNTLPVRHGKIFGPEKPTKKFSRHLFTIKYQAIIEPLFISHGYQDYEHKGQRDEVDCVGIKGRTSRFVLDLHQRKELTFEHNENLGITRKAMKMKFNTGKLDLEHFDVRAMEALFVKELNEANGTENNGTNHIFSVFDDDKTWFDLSDFREIGEPNDFKSVKATVSVFPLMFTPRLLYFKSNDYGDKYQVDTNTGKKIIPFGHEQFHDCAIGSNPSAETQERLLLKRIHELEKKMEDNLNRIDNYEPTNASPSELRFMKQLKVDNEQLRQGIKFVKNLYEAHTGGDVELPTGNTLVIPDEGYEKHSFINRFTVHNMMLKWNEQNRDVLYRYIYISEMRDTICQFVQHKALNHLDEAIEIQRKANYDGDLTHAITEATTYESVPSKPDDLPTSLNESRASAHMKRFKDDLRELLVSFNYKTHDNYLVELISPQIQLQSSEDEGAIVLVVAPSIELNGIAFDSNDDEEANDEYVFQKRIGAILSDASIFLFYESEFLSTGKLFFNSSSYGSLTQWPPWLGVELCYDGSLINDHVLMEKTSIMVQYDNPTSFFAGPEEEDITRLSCDLSQAVLRCDAKQYNSLYTIIMNLLMFNDPRSQKLKQQENKMLLSLDMDDLSGLKDRIMTLQKTMVHLEEMVDNLASRRSVLDDLELNDLYLLKTSNLDASLELYLLMKVSTVGTRKSTEDATNFLEWNIRADDIKLHMLDDSRRPFLDVIIFNSHFKRVERSDRSDRNTIVIDNLEIINLDKESSFPVVFSSFDPNHKKKHKKVFHEGDIDPLIAVNWHMDYPVGGIRLMRKFDVAVQPIQLSIEETTGMKIINYIFPDQDPLESDFDDDSSLKSSQSRQPNENGGLKRKASSPLARESFSAHARILSQREVADQARPSSNRSSFAADGISNASLDRIVMMNSAKSFVDSEEDDGLEDMVERASKFLSFVSFRLRSTVLCITFRGKGSKKLINVSNFVFRFPDVAFTNRTMTLLDLSMYIKKMLVKALLTHTGSILGNKLSSHNGPPIHNISSYASHRIQTFRDD
jgi:hypothetical protein